MIDIFVYCNIKPRRQAVADIVFMSFKSAMWRERISQWKKAKRKLSYDLGNWKEVPDTSDCGSVEDADLQRSELYNEPGKPCELAFVDVFIGIVDSLKESPLVIANTILSVFSVNYPSEKICCYVSDDGASFLTLESLLETCEFAKKWVPFCKKFSIEPRSPECYFTQKVDYLKYNVYPTFSKERRLIKRQYEDFKVRINNLEAKFENVPPHGWTMKDGTPWPGNNTGNHPGMIQILLGTGGPYDDHCRDLPRLVYVSRESRPGFQNNKTAGLINAMVRVSALLSNGAYILNLDSKQYINNSNALLEAMCFMMHRTPATNKFGYVQFPQRFDGIDVNDRYTNYSSVFYNVSTVP